jgi:pentachlorophenol monooxygenase
VDQTFRGFGRGYATLLHPESVRLFERLGIADKLRAAGHEVSGIGIRANDAPRVELRLPSPALAVPQSVLEETLLGALRHEDVEILAPCEASAIQQGPSKVTARLVRRELVTLGSPADYSDWEPVSSSTVSADFVIGADGYESRVRAALGIEHAKLGETESFAMFEVPSHGDASPDMEIAFSDGLASAVVPLVGERARVGFQIDSALDVDPDPARLHELLAARAPWFTDGTQRVDWSTVIHFERRLVRRFGAGRVWLAGDAAHVTSPFGAQSMNLGIAEACDLVRRIAACVEGKVGLEGLNEYGSERLREWHKLLGYNVKFELLPNAPAWLAAHARRIAPTLPASGADLKSLLSQLGLAIS